MLHIPGSDPILDPGVARELALDLTRRHLLASTPIAVGSLYPFRVDYRVLRKLDSTPNTSLRTYRASFSGFGIALPPLRTSSNPISRLFVLAHSGARGEHLVLLGVAGHHAKQKYKANQWQQPLLNRRSFMTE